ncbi:MAG: S8 family serine peptidase [Ignavibacteriales bacterium]
MRTHQSWLIQRAYVVFLILSILFSPRLSNAQAFDFEDILLGHSPVCREEARGSARCHARVKIDNKGNPMVTTSPSGYGPAQFLAAYGLTGIAPSDQIIAIVDAYDHPNIQSDLNTYSDTFGIPRLPACVGSITGSSVPCFQKVDQNGGQSYPKANSGWALEIALDVEIAHAICQNCKILLVEAYSSSYSDLMSAVDRAVLMDATVISNSYGSSEFSSETAYDSHLNHPGIAITFSSGDSGYGTSYPAASPYVTAGGGTSLYFSTTSITESAWSKAGSGCSVYESKPSWQKDNLCSRRTIADVSADANPNTGAAIFDSVPYGGHIGWFLVGGTSLSSPIIAGTYALAGGVGAGIWGNALPYLQSPSTNLNDIVGGKNGRCGGTYLCKAVSGYDGPTGLGTPNGVGGF